MSETMRGVNEAGLFEIEPDDYHADPCPTPSLSNSLLKPLLSQSPQHAFQASSRLNPKFEATGSDRFDLGSAVHMLTLEKGRSLQVIEADDYRTKKAQEARDMARSLGKIPIIAAKYETALDIASSIRRGLREFPGAQDALDLTRGKTEIGLFWEDAAGCWGRNLIDRLITDAPMWTVYDLKTIGRSARPDDPALGAHFVDMGYDTQAAMQERGLLTVFPELSGRLQWRFIFAEIDPPYGLSVVEPDASTMTIGRQKVKRGFELWSQCLRRNLFPSYPRKVVPLHHAEYLANRWLDRELAGEYDAANAARPDQAVENPVAQDQPGPAVNLLDAG
jgi:hypothetical protein